MRNLLLYDPWPPASALLDLRMLLADDSPKGVMPARRAPGGAADPVTVPPWEETLRAAGFHRVDSPSPGSFRHDAKGLRARLDGQRWLRLETSGSGQLAPSVLWKRIQGSPGGFRWRCDLPLAGPALGSTDAEDPEGDRRSLLQWALAAAEGNPFVGWRGPTPAEQRDWLAGPDRMTIEAQSQVRQIELGDPAQDPAHWRTRCLIGRWPQKEPPPPARLRHLHGVLQHAQSSFRMVDVVVLPDPRETGLEIWTQFDLGGIPGPHAAGLFQTGVDALRLAVRWLVPLVNLLSDPAIRIGTLDEAAAPTPDGPGSHFSLPLTSEH